MSNKIVKIVPVPEHFSITWFLTSKCNYDCMYCPSFLHDNSGEHLTLDQLKSYWLSVYEKSKHVNLKYKIALTGGEPASNKNLLPFLEWLVAEYGESIELILLSTNGSASIDRYKKLLNVVTNISFSLHSEHVDEIKFFDKISELSTYARELNRIVHVDIMDEYWNQDRIPTYKQILESYGVPYSVNEVDYTQGTRDHPIFKGTLNLDIPQS